MYRDWTLALGAVSALQAALATPVHGSSELVERQSSNGNHSAATEPFWENYTYCQGRGSSLVLTVAAIDRVPNRSKH